MGEHSQKVGIEWLETLLQMQGLDADVSAELVEDESGASCWLVIDDSLLLPEQVTVLIGERGATLDAIQYLANTVLNLGRSPDEQQAYTIELAGYRAQRQEELKALAATAAEQAKLTGEEYEIMSLSSAERRQVHHFLKGYEGLETFSRGKEPDRRLVVRVLP
jgi:spoIIIJ-associated protein